MYIIMDMEWIDRYQELPSPSQIAALRVDDQWNKVEVFSSLIQPKDAASHVWNHVSYSGASRKNFLSAPPAEAVFQSLLEWLRDDDILLWWSKEPIQIFRQITHSLFGFSPMQSIMLISSIFMKNEEVKSNPYKIADRRGLNPPSPQHVSENDVETIRLVMKSIHEHGGSVTLSSVLQDSYSQEEPSAYYYDPIAKRLHSTQSACLKPGMHLQGFDTIRSCIKRGLVPCPVCCKSKFRQDSRSATVETISNTHFNFVFKSDSDVFHTAACVHAQHIPYFKIKGAVHYKTCIQEGRRPCRICKPTPQYTRASLNPKPLGKAGSSKKASKSKKSTQGLTRTLNAAEKRAYDRYLQAAQERKAGSGKNKNSDFRTLTSSAYTFWSARGYGSFHLRNCPKLTNLTDLRGYARYDHSINRGLSPCKFCKPTHKHDLVYTAPTTGRIRKEETTELLDKLCASHGYSYKLCETLYYIITPVGKWRLHIQSLPIELWHINMVNCHGSAEDYHKQPRLLLSLLDTFNYIHKHDKSLLKKMSTKKGCEKAEEAVNSEIAVSI